MLHRTLVGKQHWRCRDYLQLDAVAVHFLQSHCRIPAGGINMAEESLAYHDFGFARLCVLDQGPVWRAIALSQVRPRRREKMIVNVDDHLRFARMHRAAMLALAQTLVAIKL